MRTCVYGLLVNSSKGSVLLFGVCFDHNWLAKRIEAYHYKTLDDTGIFTGHLQKTPVNDRPTG